VGALIGAAVSEKLLGAATRSSLPWIVYTAMSAFGACLLATLFSSIIVLGTTAGASTTDELSKIVLIGIGGGCLVAGLAVGASARVRPLIASFLGGGLGVTGFFALLARTTPDDHSDVAAGITVLACGGALVTLVGTLFGWLTVGRRSEPPAGSSPAGPRGVV
jgi:hypothetical protein